MTYRDTQLKRALDWCSNAEDGLRRMADEVAYRRREIEHAAEHGPESRIGDALSTCVHRLSWGFANLNFEVALDTARSFPDAFVSSGMAALEQRKAAKDG